MQVACLLLKCKSSLKFSFTRHSGKECPAEEILAELLAI